MKRLLFVVVALTTIACSDDDFIRTNAERYVRKTYSDVDRILYYSVDTVTYGMNLDHRIEQRKRGIESYEGFVKDAKSRAEEYKRVSYLKDLYEDQIKDMEKWQKKVDSEKACLAALDSLKNTSSQDVLNHATAFTCCLAYNVPSNLVWVQLDENGNLLKISKDLAEMFLNPGDDIPGYLEINRRFSEW